MRAPPARWVNRLIRWLLLTATHGYMVSRECASLTQVRFRFYPQGTLRAQFVSFPACLGLYFALLTGVDALAEKIADLIRNGQ